MRLAASRLWLASLACLGWIALAHAADTRRFDTRPQQAVIVHLLPQQAA